MISVSGSYDLWACTFSLHVQKREGRAVGYLLLAPHQRQCHRRATGHRCVAGGFNLRPPPPNSVTYVVETYTRPGGTFKKLDIIKLEWSIAFPHTHVHTTL